MTDRFTPSDDELRLLTEHLYYEVSMAFELTLTLATHRIDHPFVLNATVEVIPIHLRQLIDFFWSKRSSNTKTQRDAFAADYFDPGLWAGLRPNLPGMLAAAREKAGWGVAHITYGRANVTAEQKQWPLPSMCDALVPVVECFLDNVDPSKLDPVWFSEIRAVVERFKREVRRLGLIPTSVATSP